MISFKNFLLEKKVGIQVTDVVKAHRELKKIGVKVSIQLDDEIEVDISSPGTRKKVYQWMLKNGFDKAFIDDTYPEIAK